jgi:glutamyl-tRNA reductase
VSVVVVGLEHHRTSLDILERAVVPETEMSKTLASLRDRSNLLEVVVLSTCLRTELYAVVERFHEGVADLQEHLAASVDMTVEQLTEQLTVHFDDAVAEHLFEVASGLCSAVPGEHEILGQVRTAARLATAERAAGPVLTGLFDSAVKAGRRVRTETAIGRGSTSLSHLSVELVADSLGSRFNSARVVVVGAGTMASGVTDFLRSRGLNGEDITVVNRTEQKADALATSFGGRSAGLGSLAGAMADADAVIVATSAPTPVVASESVLAALSARVGRRLMPLVIVDLSMPRNVDPSVVGLGGVQLHDLVALRALADRSLAGRKAELDLAKAIVSDEVERYRSDSRARGAAPQVALLRSRLDDLRRQELDRIRNKSNDLTDDQWQQVEDATRAVLAKLLHSPTVALKETSGTPRGERLVEAIRALFDL